MEVQPVGIIIQTGIKVSVLILVKLLILLTPLNASVEYLHLSPGSMKHNAVLVSENNNLVYNNYY